MNGITFNVQILPSGMRDRDKLADNIQPDPGAAEFNKKHTVTPDPGEIEHIDPPKQVHRVKRKR